MKTNRQTIFQEIADTNHWSSNESVSGTGSELENTTSLIQKLALIINSLEINKIIDLGCGDFNWMKELNFNGEYYGVDIVSTVIDTCNEKYGNKQRKFIVSDLVTDNYLDTIGVNDNTLIICRDVLVHNTNKNIQKILNKIHDTGKGFFLTTIFPSITVNADINTGKWRPLNISEYPFNCAAPILVINENYKGEQIKIAEFDINNFKNLNLINKNYRKLKRIHYNKNFIQFQDKSIGLWPISKLK